MLTRSRVRNGLQGLALECLVNLARPRQPARSAWPLCEPTHLTIYKVVVVVVVVVDAIRNVITDIRATARELRAVRQRRDGEGMVKE